MAPKRRPYSASVVRSREVAAMLAIGMPRREIIQQCSEQWGVGARQADTYIAYARQMLREDWTIQREEMLAQLLSQLATLQMKARDAGQLHIALGCINAAARLAQIVS